MCHRCVVQFIWKTAIGLMCCFTTAHVSPEYSRTDKNCIFTDRVKALEDQMLARLSCWKALFAAATQCVISASKVQSEVKTLPKYLTWDTTSSGSPRSVMTESAAFLPTQKSTLVFCVLIVSPQRKNVASMVMTASLSFSVVSHAKEKSSAYSRIHISTFSVGFLQCMSWPFIL